MTSWRMFSIENILGLYSEGSTNKIIVEERNSSSSEEYPIANFANESVIKFKRKHSVNDLESKVIDTNNKFHSHPRFEDYRVSRCKSPAEKARFDFEHSRKKLRTSFTKNQLEKLEASFRRHKYLTVKDRIFLSNNLKLSDVQIKTWYQNRRTKWKRESSRKGFHIDMHSNWILKRKTSGNFEARNILYKKTMKDNWFGGSKLSPDNSDDDDQCGSNLFEVEERFFRSITTLESYEMIKRWHFNAFMCAFANHSLTEIDKYAQNYKRLK